MNNVHCKKENSQSFMRRSRRARILEEPIGPVHKTKSDASPLNVIL
jgi:hypothetical protein